MPRRRVQLFNQSRGVEIDTDATVGAVVGQNLFLADGTVVTVDMILNVEEDGDGLGAVYWRTIQERPPNVDALAAQEGTGLYVITGPGASETREISSSTLNVQNGDGVAGDPAVDLPDLPDAGGGALRKIERDQYGRVSGTSEATTDDLPEGSNLYFTDQRARDAVGAVAGGVLPVVTGEIINDQPVFVYADDGSLIYSEVA